ncbi:MAG: calcineurin-like phosphoesterase family protein, partial [Muribaculaceae bacterium]
MLATLFSLSTAASGTLEVRQISGCVSSQGRGLAGVAVTDGSNIVLTDSMGRYSLATLSLSQFVYITTPSGYDVPVASGSIPQFYHTLTPSDSIYDFHLTPSATDDNRHAFVVHTDVQVTSKADVAQFSKQIVTDTKQTLQHLASQGYKVFGTDCGDIVGDTPSLFDDYIRACQVLNTPFFRIIGNHDMDYWGRSFETSYRTFSSLFGPTHYSFNCGKAHYIFINDNFYTGFGINYIGYIPESTLRWLEQDLNLLPKGSPVFVFMHIPTAESTDLDHASFNYDWLANVRQFHYMFKDFDTHIVSGHTHFNMNLEFNSHLYEHVTAAVCGTWWRTEECMDGTPRGYGVFTVDGERVSWQYKSAGYPSTYQLRAYTPGSAAEYPDEVVANVWNYDSRWR